jgi:hypothetical protein
MIVQTFYAGLNFSSRNLLDLDAGGTFMSLTLGAATKLLDNMMVNAVTQHTTACCSMQVVDITLAKQASTNITSLRMVQQKHCGPKYNLFHILLQTKA